MNKERKQQSFLLGAAILVVGTALVKVIGALFKIPLGNIFDGTGMGYFSSAYDLYLPIYSLATAGLPIAISRIVAQRVAEKRYKDVFQTLRVAQRAFLAVGTVGTLILTGIVWFYINYTGNGGVLFSMICIIPALLFCCVMSSYRGFYEGLRNMYPTAVSSVIEALGKLILGLGMAYAVIIKAKSELASSGTIFGKMVEVTPGASNTEIDALVKNVAAPYASAAAILGITIGSVIATVYLIFYHKLGSAKITKEEITLSPAPISSKQTLKNIVSIAVPVVIASLVMSVSSLIDLFTVQSRLTSAVNASPEAFLNMYDGLLPQTVLGENMANEIAVYLYGCFKGYGFSIYNLVPSITCMFGVSALPVLTTVWIEKNRPEIKRNVESMVKVTAIVSMPAGLGITALAGPILKLLYPNAPSEVAISTPLLTILGITAIFTGLTTPITNMLQAIGKQNIPMRNIAIGALLKIIINVVLVGIPQINIVGAAIGTFVCYAFHFVASLYALNKHSGAKMDLMSVIFKPLIAAAACAVAAYATHGIIAHFVVAPIIGEGLINKLVNMGVIETVCAILVAVIVYAVVLLLIKGITADDLKMMPKGEKLAKVLKLDR